jgi:hypothetical protein
MWKVELPSTTEVVSPKSALPDVKSRVQFSHRSLELQSRHNFKLVGRTRISWLVSKHLRHIFYDELHVVLDDYPIVMTEESLTPRSDHDKLM